MKEALEFFLWVFLVFVLILCFLCRSIPFYAKDFFHPLSLSRSLSLSLSLSFSLSLSLSLSLSFSRSLSLNVFLISLDLTYHNKKPTFILIKIYYKKMSHHQSFFFLLYCIDLYSYFRRGDLVLTRTTMFIAH